MKSNLKQIITTLVISSTLFTSFASACNESCPKMRELHKKDQGHHGDFKKKTSDRLSNKLDLTADQKTKVDSILEASHKKTKAVFDEVHPKMEAIRKSTDEEIKAVLTSEQKVKFEKLQDKREEKIKKWHSTHE